MSRTLFMKGITLPIVLPAAVMAQAAFGIAAGASAPQGDFAHVAQTGYHLTGLVTAGASHARVRFRGEASISELKYDGSLAGTTAKARILSVTANAVLASPSLAGLYGIAGLGAYRMSAVCSGCTTSTTKLGYNAGVGFEHVMSGFPVFLEARLHYIPGA